MPFVKVTVKCLQCGHPEQTQISETMYKAYPAMTRMVSCPDCRHDHWAIEKIRGRPVFYD